MASPETRLDGWRSSGPVAAIGKVSGKQALIVMALSLINADTFNAYTGAFQVLAFGSMWHRCRAARCDGFFPVNLTGPCQLAEMAYNHPDHPIRDAAKAVT